ncbi:MAG: hypothetical protein ABIS38_00325 [Sphingomicrobium sp.]
MSDEDPSPLGRAAGGGSRRPRRTTDAAAASLALGDARRDPAVAADADAFLREQLALTKLQVAHFEAEHRHAVDGSRASRALEAMKLILQEIGDSRDGL